MNTRWLFPLLLVAGALGSVPAQARDLPADRVYLADRAERSDRRDIREQAREPRDARRAERRDRFEERESGYGTGYERRQQQPPSERSRFRDR